MASLNKVMLIGNLGKDPETRYTPAGLAITTFSIATTERNKDQQEKTEWHRIVTFNKQAENCAKFLSKGRQVYVEGRLQTSSYEKDGITRYSTEIIAYQVTFLNGQPQQGGVGQGQPEKRFQYPNNGNNPNTYPRQEDLPY